MALTNEQILEEIRVAMSDNSDTKKKINEALTHAQTAIQNMEKRLQAEYERGCEETWNLARRIGTTNLHGGFTADELVGIFDTIFPHVIFNDHPTFKAVNEKVKAYEEKKNKLTRGDEIVVHCLHDNDVPDEKGIFIKHFNTNECIILFPDYTHTQTISNKDYTLTKTGRHVDIFGDEDKKGEK